LTPKAGSSYFSYPKGDFLAVISISIPVPFSFPKKPLEATTIIPLEEMTGRILEIIAPLMVFVSLTIGFLACAVRPAPLEVPGHVRPYDIILTTQSQIAKPYRLGGSSPESGFDCSGLVFWTYAQHGIQLPRTAGEQMDIGQEVGRHELQPGDLVFFKIKGKGFFAFFLKSSLHVGLYTNDGKFVHAPSSGKSVKEDRISNGYWDECYLTARRILGQLPR
jgi:hypothetical protein